MARLAYFHVDLGHADWPAARIEAEGLHKAMWPGAILSVSANTAETEAVVKIDGFYDGPSPAPWNGSMVITEYDDTQTGDILAMMAGEDWTQLGA